MAEVGEWDAGESARMRKRLRFMQPGDEKGVLSGFLRGDDFTSLRTHATHGHCQNSSAPACTSQVAQPRILLKAMPHTDPRKKVVISCHGKFWGS